MARVKLDKVGADIEYFLLDKEGKPVPCIGIVGGTKDKPLPLISGMEGYTIQEDNVSLEWGIPPAPDKWSFVYSCLRAREEIDSILKSKELSASVVSSMRFDAKQLEHPQAKTLGCESDYNVWERTENPKPDITGENETLRTAAAHIHISFTVDDEPIQLPLHLPEVELIVKACDVYIGLASVLLDSDQERRKLYGKAGAFRPKPYGVEYRVPGNFWTKEPYLIAWIYDQIKHIINQANSHSFGGAVMEYKEFILKAINESNQTMAKTVMSNWGIHLPLG